LQFNQHEIENKSPAVGTFTNRRSLATFFQDGGLAYVILQLDLNFPWLTLSLCLAAPLLPPISFDYFFSSPTSPSRENLKTQ